MWFATDRGLSKFDGNSFRNFTLEDGLPELAVYRIFRDHHDRIWCLNASSTLFYVENDEVHLYEYNHLLEGKLSSADDAINILVDKNDGIHLGYDKSGYHHITKDGVHTMFGMEAQKHIGPWFKSIDDSGIIFRTKNRKGLQSEFVYVDGADTSFYNLDHIIRDDVRKIRPSIKLSTGHGMIVIGSSVCLVNKDSFVTYNTNGLPLSSCEAGGKAWVGEYNGGITGFKLGTLEPVIKVLRGYSVSSVHQDHEGGYWFSTLDAGVFYTPSLELRTVAIDTDIKRKKIVAISDIDTAILAGQLDGTLLSYRNGKCTNIDYDRSNINTIVTIFRDPKTHGPVISSYTGTYLLESNLTTSPFERGSVRAHAVEPISRKSLLVSTSGWIKAYDGQNIVDSFKTYKRPLAIHCGKDSAIHFGTFTGYSILEDNQLLDQSDAHELMSTRTNSITTSSERVFLGSMGEGIIVVEDDSVWQITTENGLSSDFVNVVIMDDNQLIAGTSLGVSLIDFSGNTYSIRNIDLKDGLISNEVTCLLTKNDSLWIGTRKGLSLIPNQQFECANANPIVNLVALKVNNEEIDASTHLELEHHQNKIEIVFNGISYKQNGVVDFRYKLDGASENWVHTTITRVRFTGLASGDYKFHLEMNIDGKWVTALSPMEIWIDAPFWQKWWVLLLINLGIVAILIFIYVRRLKVVKQRNSVQEQLKNFQLQALAAQMSPHFLFNSLNAIQDVLLHKTKLEASSYLSRFARLMRTVLENTTKSEVPLQDELDALELYLDLEMLRIDRGFDYKLEIADDVNTHEVKVPNLLIQPFAENAIWHGLRHRSEPGGILHIRIKYRNDELICQIEDNGVGRAFHSDEKTQRDEGSSITDKRLKLLLGDENHLTVKDLQNEHGNPCGTLVEIRLPDVRKY